MRRRINHWFNLVSGCHSQRMHGQAEITFPSPLRRMSLEEARRMYTALGEAVQVLEEDEMERSRRG
jgi:hypothetical protein